MTDDLREKVKAAMKAAYLSEEAAKLDRPLDEILADAAIRAVLTHVEPWLFHQSECKYIRGWECTCGLEDLRAALAEGGPKP